MPVELTRRDEFAVITLNRPEALNALSFQIVCDIGAALSEVAEFDARAVLFIGAGDRVIATDGELESGEFSLALARELARVTPWGQGFPEPRFDGEFRIDDRRVVGGSHARLVLSPAAGGETIAAIAFGAAGESWFSEGDSIRAVYKLDVNDYRGLETLQLVIDYAERI